MQLKDLKQNPKNPRRTTDKRLEALKESLDKFGDLSGFIFNQQTQTLIGGHQRHKVMPSDAEIVIEHIYDTPTACKTVREGYVLINGEKFKYRAVDADVKWETEAMLAANRNAGEWDLAMLDEIKLEIPEIKIDFDPIELDTHKTETETESPEPELEKVVPIVKVGDVWHLGAHRIMCGDSANLGQVGRLMQGAKADLIFTDPPYNVAQHTSGYASSAPTNKQNEKLMASEWDKDFSFKSIEDSILEVLSENGSVYICTSHYLFAEIMDFLHFNFDFAGYCVWAKPNPFPSLAKRHWAFCTELIPFATRGKHKFNYPEEGNALSAWSIPVGEGGLHPTQKPVAVPTRAILHASEPKDLVVDLFLGSGTTLIACEKTDRRCFGMEINPEYCDVILQRWAKLTGKDPMRSDGFLYSSSSSFK